MVVWSLLVTLVPGEHREVAVAVALVYTARLNHRPCPVAFYLLWHQRV
jgi:hypothetical protein